MLKRTLLLATLPAMLLAGCTGTVNRGVESVHQPVVERADYAFDLNAGAGGLAPGESQRLGGWMQSLRLGYGDRIAIDDPSYGQATRADVSGQAARYGLLLSDDAPITNTPVTPGTVRVVISRSRASVPECPDYSRMALPGYEGNTSSNYGCAINSTLAAMIGDPSDLVRGAGSTGYDPAIGSRAIDSFRKAAPSGGGGTTVKAESAGGK